MEVLPLTDGKRLIADAVDKGLSAIVATIQKHLGGDFPCLKIAIVTVLLSLFITFPHYKEVSEDSSGQIAAVVFKTQHPLSPFPARLTDPRGTMAESIMSTPSCASLRRFSDG